MPLSFLSCEGTDPTIDKAFYKADLPLKKKIWLILIYIKFTSFLLIK